MTIDYEQEYRHQQWLRAALEMSRVLLGDVDHVQALRIVTAQTRKVSGADYAAIVTVDPAAPDATALIEAIDGLGMDHAADTPIPLKGLTAKVVTSGRAVISRNITHEEDFDPPDVVADALSVLGLGMYLPLAVARTVLGVLVVGWRRGSPHEQRALEEAESIEMFANQAALALQQVHTRLLVAQDRARIANELRDDVIEQLFAIGTELHTVSALIDRPDLQRRMHGTIERLDETTQKVRATVFAIHQQTPAVRDSVTSQILDAIDAANTTFGFTPRLVVHGPVDRPLPPHIQPEFVRAIRYGLTHVASHGSPTKVEVDVEVTDDRLCLTLRDDGQSADESAHPCPALVEIRASAEQLGGSCDVHTSQSGETVVDWRIPLPS